MSSPTALWRFLARVQRLVGRWERPQIITNIHNLFQDGFLPKRAFALIRSSAAARLCRMPRFVTSVAGKTRRTAPDRNVPGISALERIGEGYGLDTAGDFSPFGKNTPA